MTDTLAAQIEALAPCPHCGPGQSIVEAVQQEIGTRWQIFCGRCGSSSGSTKTVTEAAALWNTRPTVVTALRQAEVVTQPCDRCGKPVTVNAVSPSECFCSAECADPEEPEQAEAATGVVEEWKGPAYEYGVTWGPDNASTTDEAALRQAEAAPGVVEALQQCREQFAFYTREHLAAGKNEKAGTNQRFVTLCDDALHRPELLALARQHGAREDGWTPITEAKSRFRYIGAFRTPLQDDHWTITSVGTVRDGVFHNHLGAWEAVSAVLHIPPVVLPAAPATDVGAV